MDISTLPVIGTEFVELPVAEGIVNSVGVVAEVRRGGSRCGAESSAGGSAVESLAGS